MNYVPPGNNQPPVATIDHLSPNPASEGTDVVFVGGGRDSDGDAIVRYRWESSVQGLLSEEAMFAMGDLSPGTHTISLRVMDARGLWSAAVMRTLTVNGASARILDNGDPGTSFTGVWSPSGGADPYGGSSLYARHDATYSYRFTGLEGGAYHVFAWWTEWSSRSNRVPYEIRHALGTRTIYVDQLQGGGRWSYLGTFIFGLEASVTIRAAGLATYCADAVSIVRSDNLAPTATIVSISPRSPISGQPVAFEGQARDTDGSIVATEWRSDLDGLLSTQRLFSTDSLSVGRHEILFRARDDDGEWSDVAWDTIEVRSDREVILDNSDPGTTATGSWLSSSAPDPYGSISLYAKGSGSYAYAFSGLVAGRYRVHAWWTEWPSRSTSVTIEIRHSTDTASVAVNQRTDGGQWNALGEFDFTDTALVTIRVDGSDPNASTCADAIRLERVP